MVSYPRNAARERFSAAVEQALQRHQHKFDLLGEQGAFVSDLKVEMSAIANRAIEKAKADGNVFAFEAAALSSLRTCGWNALRLIAERGWGVASDSAPAARTFRFLRPRMHWRETFLGRTG